MKSKLNYLQYILIIIIIMISSHSYAGTDNTPDDSSFFKITFDAIHVDFTTFLFLNDLSILVDFRLARNSILIFGLQPSYSLFSAFGPYGDIMFDSKDISLLAYMSLGYNMPIMAQATLGYSYRMNKRGYYYIKNGMKTEKYSVGGLKYGLALLINISRNFKIHAKISNIHNVGVSAYGIGFWLGWSR